MGLFSKKNKNAPTVMQKATQSVMLSIQSDSRGKVKLTQSSKRLIQMNPGEVQFIEEKGKIYTLNKVDLDIIPNSKHSSGLLYLTDKDNGQKIVIGFQVTKDAGMFLKTFIPAFWLALGLFFFGFKERTFG